MIAKDIIVYLHERYGMTKDEFVKTMYNSAGHIVRYEEDSSVKKLPNVDYGKLFVGARIYISEPQRLFRNEFKEAEVTHLYGGIMFYKYIGEEKEYWSTEDSFHFMKMVYPKVVVKPDYFDMTCYCDKTKFVNYDEYTDAEKRLAEQMICDTERVIDAVNKNLPHIITESVINTEKRIFEKSGEVLK